MKKISIVFPFILLIISCTEENVKPIEQTFESEVANLIKKYGFVPVENLPNGVDQVKGNTINGNKFRDEIKNLAKAYKLEVTDEAIGTKNMQLSNARMTVENDYVITGFCTFDSYSYYYREDGSLSMFCIGHLNWCTTGGTTQCYFYYPS